MVISHQFLVCLPEVKIYSGLLWNRISHAKMREAPSQNSWNVDSPSGYDQQFAMGNHPCLLSSVKHQRTSISAMASMAMLNNQMVL